MHKQINWFDKISNDLNNFKVNYQKLADASAKSKNYLAIKNINIPNDVDFEGN